MDDPWGRREVSVREIFRATSKEEEFAVHPAAFAHSEFLRVIDLENRNFFKLAI